LNIFGGELANFYYDGVKILKSNEFKSKANLLAHLAREIDGAFRDVFKNEGIIDEIKTSENRAKVGHLASILCAIGIKDINSKFANKWWNVAKLFSRIAHRSGDYTESKNPKEMEKLWEKYEEILYQFIGSYIERIKRLDIIMRRKVPVKETLNVLKSMLNVKNLSVYFYGNLTSSRWLKPLMDNGFLAPELNPKPYEIDGNLREPSWEVLPYILRIAKENPNKKSENTTNLIIKFINDVINYKNENGGRTYNYFTDLIIVNIITYLPPKKFDKKYLKFLEDILLYYKNKFLFSSIIERSLFPYLLNNELTEETYKLIKIVIKENKNTSLMDSYLLREALFKNKNKIIRLFGIKIYNLFLERIMILKKKDKNAFSLNERYTLDYHINDDEYEYILLSFLMEILKRIENDSIKTLVKNLINKDSAIFKKIGLKIIDERYNLLNDIFWGINLNSIDLDKVEPELFRLLDNNCEKFNRKQIETIIDWFENIDCSNRKRKQWLNVLRKIKDKFQFLSKIFKKYEIIVPGKVRRLDIVPEPEWGPAISPINKENILKMKNKELIKFLRNYDDINRPLRETSDGLSEELKKSVKENPSTFADGLENYKGIEKVYIYSIIRGFKKAIENNKNFNLKKLFKYFEVLISEKDFWKKEKNNSYRYDNFENEIIIAIADIIIEVTKKHDNAFTLKNLPQIERILLKLLNNVNTDLLNVEGMSLPEKVLNSSKGRVLRAIISYCLKKARMENKEQPRWSKRIKNEFNKRLDRRKDNSIEYSFTLGAFLPQLFYLDKKWVLNNLNKIFNKKNIKHWKAAFTGYLSNVNRVDKETFKILREKNHYSKVLRTEFDMNYNKEKVVQHVCLAYLYDEEDLNDESSLINEIFKVRKSSQLQEIINFILKQKDQKEILKNKLKPLWKKMVNLLKENCDGLDDIKENFVLWLSIVDEIDDEKEELLNFSIKHLKTDKLIHKFIKILSKFSDKEPKKVSSLFLLMLKKKIFPRYDLRDAKKIVETLYRKDLNDQANKICNLFVRKGIFDFKNIYEKYNK